MKKNKKTKEKGMSHESMFETKRAFLRQRCHPGGNEDNTTILNDYDNHNRKATGSMMNKHKQ